MKPFHLHYILALRQKVGVQTDLLRAFNVALGVVNEQRLIGIQFGILQDILEGADQWFPNMFQMRKIGLDEASLKDVEAEFLLQ